MADAGIADEPDDASVPSSTPVPPAGGTSATAMSATALVPAAVVPAAVVPAPAFWVSPSSATSIHGTDALARRGARERTRRAWRRYLAAMTVAALLLAGFIAFTWAHGEIRHVRSHTSGVKARALPGGRLAATLTERWHSTDRAALGSPADLDVVTAYGGHTVSGRDARTGAVRWSYTRTDRALCAAAAQPDVVVAVYAHDGICDEATGLNPLTGARNWTRTLFGAGSQVSIQAGSGYFLFVRPGSLNLLKSNGTFQELDGWNDVQPAGCTTARAVLGTSGVLFQNSCATGDTLAFRTLDGGDKRAWTVPAAGRAPLGADGNIVALGSTGRVLEVLATKKGSVSRRIRLSRAARPPATPRSIDLIDSAVDVLDVAGGAIGVSDGSAPALLWQRSTGLLSATDLGVLEPRTGTVSTLAPQTGSLTPAASVAGLVPAARLTAVGTGLLADTPGGVTVYR